MSHGLTPPAPGELILYQTEDGQSRMEIRFDGDTLWLTQAQMAELFQTTVANIATHLRALSTEGEIDPNRTIKQYLIVRSECGRTTYGLMTRRLPANGLPRVTEEFYAVLRQLKRSMVTILGSVAA